MHEPDSAELEALLARCATGDRAALETLYARVAPMLLAVLMRMLKRRDAAEDALQDVFVSVWQRARQFDPIRGRPLAWLVSHGALPGYRSAARRAAGSGIERGKHLRGGPAVGSG